MRTIIKVKPHGQLWKVVEAVGVEPIFPDREKAMLHATERSRSGSGEIHVFDANGTVERVISF